MKKKIGFIWNTAGSLIYSFFNAIVLMVCTRLNGTEIAGIFSICYATGCILNAIGDLGIRIFQVTDTKRKYRFEDYLYARGFAVIMMLLVALAFSIISGYTNEKFFICVILILIRVVDNFGETFQAEFQLNERLDIAGKALLYRNILEIISFAIIDIITCNIYISFIAMLVIGIIILIIYDIRLIKKQYKILGNLNLDKIKEILKECIPLGLSTLISMYVINAVKYAIDVFGDNTMQTYFNVLYMPTFVINLVSILIMKPLLKPFGEYWNNNDGKKLVKTIIKIILFLSGITVIIEILALTIGIPMLGWLYAMDLSNYRLELFLLILSGLFYASSTVIFYALGTIRKQKQTTVSYIICSVFAFIISNILVKNYGILGSTISSVLIMATLFIILLLFFIISYIGEKSEK